MDHVARRRPVTQRAIADIAGVSVATVSRVLSAKEGEATRWASPDKVREILQIAQDHGYRRNPQAASLRTQRSGLIGVIVPRLQDFVLATIYEGIDEAATEHGLATLVTNSLDEVDRQRAKTLTLLDRRVDGIIYGDAHLDDPFLDELRPQHVPFVLTSRRKPPHISVTCDDYLGGRLIGEHLLELGRTEVAILAGLEFASTAQDRSRGLIDRLAEAGIDVPPDRLLYRGFDAAGGRRAMTELLDAGHVPDAVFAANDFAAIGALGVLRERGLGVPDDVALVGYNDTPLAESVGIPLTTVRSPMHQMGRRATETLLDVLEGRTPNSSMLTPTLLVRTSTVGALSP